MKYITVDLSLSAVNSLVGIQSVFPFLVYTIPYLSAVNSLVGIQSVFPFLDCTIRYLNIKPSDSQLCVSKYRKLSSSDVFYPPHLKRLKRSDWLTKDGGSVRRMTSVYETYLVHEPAFTIFVVETRPKELFRDPINYIVTYIQICIYKYKCEYTYIHIYIYRYV